MTLARTGENSTLTAAVSRIRGFCRVHKASEPRQTCPCKSSNHKHRIRPRISRERLAVEENSAQRVLTKTGDVMQRTDRDRELIWLDDGGEDTDSYRRSTCCLERQA